MNKIEFDDERQEQLEDLSRLVNLSGSLDHGSGITGKIKELEGLARRLSTSDMMTPKSSFLLWLRDVILKLRATNESGWIDCTQYVPEEGQWVLHVYRGGRMPIYGVFRLKRFWSGGGPESFPTTHWMYVPMIPPTPDTDT
jgi:hypothetical protein